MVSSLNKNRGKVREETFYVKVREFHKNIPIIMIKDESGEMNQCKSAGICQLSYILILEFESLFLVSLDGVLFLISHLILQVIDATAAPSFFNFCDFSKTAALILFQSLCH